MENLIISFDLLNKNDNQFLMVSKRVLREKSSKVNIPENAIDTCGTGGDKSGTYNISTAATIVAAGAGCIIAKHGNRALTSKSGSSQVLEELGVKINVSENFIMSFPSVNLIE